MKVINSFGRFLDQPMLITKFEKNIPPLLGIGGALFTASEINNAPMSEKKKVGLKNAIILIVTILSAIKAPQIADKIIGRAGNNFLKFEDNISKSDSVIKNNEMIIRNVLQNNKSIPEQARTILKKSLIGKILNLREVHNLRNNIDEISFNKIIPEPVSVTSKEIFKEIGWLSIFGAVPVIGGVLGGILADAITEKNWKQGINNKIKEGIYQYLANIFMCNVGAGIALLILEKMGLKSKVARCIGMVTGIILTGVIGGSYIANLIGNKFINPLLGKNTENDLRKPEMLDISLHTDDIATVAVLSGLRWIEPILPVLYSISGYRAGIGYRNDNSGQLNKEEKNFLRHKC